MRHLKSSFLKSRRQLLRSAALAAPLVAAFGSVARAHTAPSASASAPSTDRDALERALERYGSEFGQIHHPKAGD